MSASLASTLSLITGPALLTNASTVLLLGATNRLGMALDRQAIKPAVVDLHAARRVTLLRRAMLLLQTAVGSFGTGTLIAMLGLCIEQTISPGADAFANPAVLCAATVGGIALILGVITLFVESWSFGVAPRIVRGAGKQFHGPVRGRHDGKPLS
ncbi:hypothetical protein [Cupriavidus pauculus]|uniref:hypothetical protein n=1 Tax=Cupriavidus pauculus TaxID=82633 RepID=UPI000784B958|nr:hypothetical protein [Cupriavidus pauculus]